MSECPSPCPDRPELAEVSQLELEKIKELDDLIETMQWIRNRQALKIASRIEAGACVEPGPRRGFMGKRRFEVR